LWGPVLKFIDENRGYYAGIWTNRSGKTSDGGHTWTDNSLGLGTFFSDEYWGTVCPQNWLEVKGDTLWFGTSKRIVRSLNGGMSWENHFPEFPGNNMISSIAFNDSGHGLAISDVNFDLPMDDSFLDFTIAWKSEDYGANWELLPNIEFPLTVITQVPGRDKSFVAISGSWQWFDPQSQLSWASAYTTDGGETWTEIDRGIPYNSLAFASVNAGWAGAIGSYDYGFAPGEKPAVFKWEGFPSSAGHTQVEPKITLSPNPATDILRVQFPETITQPIEVSLFSLSGKWIKSQMMAAGQDIEVKGLAPGMYWVKAVVRGRVLMGKFCKL